MTPLGENLEADFWFLLTSPHYHVPLPCACSSLYPFTVISHACMCAQLCLTLCNTIDYSPSGLSVHGILQARILEWVTAPFYRGSSWPRNWTHVSCISWIGRWFLFLFLFLFLPLSHLGSLVINHNCKCNIFSTPCESFQWTSKPEDGLGNTQHTTNRSLINWCNGTIYNQRKERNTHTWESIHSQYMPTTDMN